LFDVMEPDISDDRKATMVSTSAAYGKDADTGIVTDDAPVGHVVRPHATPAQLHALLSTMAAEDTIAVSDAGADTCVLGDGWTVISSTHRKANLVGFDARSARKNGLDVVSACAIVESAEGDDILLIAHESVSNPGSRITLLSEFQIRSFGSVIDSVHRGHRADWNGRLGTQSFQPTEDLMIPLVLRGALMTFKLRAPTEAEMETMEPVPITSEHPWRPSLHRDDVYNMLSINAVLNQIPYGTVERPADYMARMARHDVMENDPFYEATTDDDDDVDISTLPSLRPTPSVSSIDHDDSDDDAKDAKVLRPPIDEPRDPILPKDSDDPDDQARFPTARLRGETFLSSSHVTTFDSTTQSSTKPRPSSTRTATNERQLGKWRLRLKKKRDFARSLLRRKTPTDATTTEITDSGELTDAISPQSEGVGRRKGIDMVPSPPRPLVDIASRVLPDPLVHTVIKRDFVETFIGEEPIFHDAMEDATDDLLMYFDPSDDFSPESQYGKIFALQIDTDVFVHEPEVDSFLDALDTKELNGYNDVFDSFTFGLRAVHKFTEDELEKVQPYLGFRPLRVIRETLRHTTQLCKNIVLYPMKRHMASRFPFAYVNRLNESVATDTYFANVRSVDGYTCAQAFYGLSSHQIDVYGMRRESEFPDRYRDFLRSEGAPSILRRDNSKAQQSDKVADLNRKYLIDDNFSEAYFQNQNPVESRAIQWLKRNGEALMNRTNAPDFLWFQAHQYLADIHAVTADETLNWMTPRERRHGQTPDISAFLHFKFYEKVYYLDTVSDFPRTKEKTGYWLGVAHSVGDALTYRILTDDTEQIITRSVVRPYRKGSLLAENLRLTFDKELDPERANDTVDSPMETESLASGETSSDESDDSETDIETEDDMPHLQFTDHKVPVIPDRARRPRLQAKRKKKKLRREQRRRNREKDHSSVIAKQSTEEGGDMKRVETAVPVKEKEKVTEVATSHDDDVGTLFGEPEPEAEVKRTRSGRATKPRDVLTFTSTRSSHTFHKEGLPLTLLLLAAAIGLTHLFRTHDPMQTIEALERQAVTGVKQEDINTVPTFGDEIPKVDYSGLTEAAKEQFKKIQALDMLSSLNGDSKEDDDAWNAVAVLQREANVGRW